MAESAAGRSGIAFTREQRVAWLRLYRSDNVGPTTFRELINHFGTAAAALEALPGLADRMRQKTRAHVVSEQQAEDELGRLERAGGRLICMGEPDYPATLRGIEGAPPILALRGRTDCLHQPMIAFVGSRNASLAGVKFTGQLAKAVGAAGFATVSGLARGIDSAAHEASVENGTVAVFAGGVDHIYPPENADLAQAIIDNGGALISEMPVAWKPRAQDFPRRNRIVAGLCIGLVVVEAAQRSGSLISARLANEYGREVFAVPGSPLDPRSIGTNQLIRQGATLITGADDIVDAVNPLIGKADQQAYSLEQDGPSHDYEAFCEDVADPGDRQRLFDALDYTPIETDELIRHLQMSPALVQLILLELDLAGQLERHPGGRVSRR